MLDAPLITERRAQLERRLGQLHGWRQAAVRAALVDLNVVATLMNDSSCARALNLYQAVIDVLPKGKPRGAPPPGRHRQKYNSAIAVVPAGVPATRSAKVESSTPTIEAAP